MKKRTITIVSITLVLAILAVSVIATFPSYLFEEEKDFSASNTTVQSDKITESVKGDDVGEVGGNQNNGVEAVLPDVEIEDGKGNTTPSTNLKTVASDGGAKLMAENAAFPDGTEFEVDELGLFDKKYYRARNYVRDFANEYTMYDITAQKDGKDVHPVGVAKVVIEIPEDYNLDYVEVYYVLPGGGIQKLPCTIDKDARTATVSFMQSGVYILIEKNKDVKDDAASNSTSTESEDKTSSATSSDTDSGNSSTDNTDSSDSSEENTSSDAGSDSSSTEPDPNKDTMDGWTPWY